MARAAQPCLARTCVLPPRAAPTKSTTWAYASIVEHSELDIPQSRRWVIFDYDGVLTEPALPRAQLESSPLLADVTDALRKLQTGSIDICEFFNSISDVHLLPDSWTIPSPRQQVLSYVSLLRKLSVRVALLTNSTRAYAAIRNGAGVHDDDFDIVIESWRVGIRKPDEKIFMLALALMKTGPQQCVFIDDEIVNIEIARELGFNVIHALSERALVEALEAYVARHKESAQV
jgi:epoxide hydrolase-like predicted phosphatase